MTATIDFGWITMPNGRRSLVTYWADCCLVALDGPGGTEVLGFVANEAEVRLRLKGWEEVVGSAGALDWVRARVAGRVAEPLGGVHHARPATTNRLIGSAGA